MMAVYEKRPVDPGTRRANVRLALVLGFVALGFFFGFIVLSVT